MVLLPLTAMPGLMELIVVLFIDLIRIAIALLAAVAIYHYLNGKYSYERRIVDLERRVAELEDDQS